MSKEQEKAIKASTYLIALIIGIAINTAFFIPDLDQTAEYLYTGFSFPLPDFFYSILAASIFPVLYALFLYVFTGQKRIGSPVLIQVGTVVVSTLMVVADSFIRLAPSFVIFSFNTYLNYLLPIVVLSFMILAVIGSIQSLIVRAIVGLQAEEPDRLTYSINMDFPSLAVEMDDDFLYARRLTRKKFGDDDILLFVARRTTGEETVIAIGKQDNEHSFLATVATDRTFYDLLSSPESKYIRDSIIRDFRTKIQDKHSVVFAKLAEINDSASRKAYEYAMRPSKPRLSTASFRIIRETPRQYLWISTLIILTMVLVGIIYGYHILPNYDSGTFIETEVGLFIALAIDVSFAIRDERQRRKEIGK